MLVVMNFNDKWRFCGVKNWWLSCVQVCCGLQRIPADDALDAIENAVWGISSEQNMAGRDDGIEVVGGGRVGAGDCEIFEIDALACVVFGSVELSRVVLNTGADDVCG